MKGPKDTYALAAFASWIWELGHARLIIQSDIFALVAMVGDKVIADGKAEQITCQVSKKRVHTHRATGERCGELTVVGMVVASCRVGIQPISRDS